MTAIAEPTRAMLMDVACHEAAHAVVGTMLGCRVAEVTIVPTADYVGGCRFEPLPADFQPGMCDRLDADDPAAKLLERLIIARMAGGVAGKRFSGEYAYEGCRHDLETILTLLCYLTGNAEDLQPEWARLWARAVALVDEYWGAIAWVAKVLLDCGTISGDRLRVLISLVPGTIAEQWTSGLAASAAEGSFYQ